METLAEIRGSTGEARTLGLGDGVIRDFLESDPSLSRAIEEASDNFQSLKGDLGGKLFEMGETDLVSELQSDYVNFYKAPTVNPYVAIAARGPWIITSHGAVLHDNGGYGMLGFGHAPENVLAAVSEDLVIANIMTKDGFNCTVTAKAEQIPSTSTEIGF